MVREISAADLEAACRKCTRLKVSDTKTLARVLDTWNLSYDILPGGEADIYAEVNITRLVLALNEEHCEILNVQERDESLESYYINLIGGGRHE